MIWTSLQQCLALLTRMKVFHSSCQESFLMQRTELLCCRLFWTTHICFQVCMVFGCRITKHSFYLPPPFSALPAFEWASLEQRQVNSLAAFSQCGNQWWSVHEQGENLESGDDSQKQCVFWPVSEGMEPEGVSHTGLVTKSQDIPELLLRLTFYQVSWSRTV